MGKTAKNLSIYALGIIFGLFVAAANMEVEDAQAEAKMYCESVHDWKASNGQRGWPDYNGNYEELCKKGL